MLPDAPGLEVGKEPVVHIIIELVPAPGPEPAVHLSAGMGFVGCLSAEASVVHLSSV